MMGNVIGNEMETDAVFWWATIFCIEGPLFFPSSRHNFLSLNVFSWNFGGVGSVGALKCARLGSLVVVWVVWRRVVWAEVEIWPKSSILVGQ